MRHPLDNPVWDALTGSQHGKAVRYDADVYVGTPLRTADGRIVSDHQFIVS